MLPTASRLPLVKTRELPGSDVRDVPTNTPSSPFRDRGQSSDSACRRRSRSPSRRRRSTGSSAWRTAPATRRERLRAARHGRGCRRAVGRGARARRCALRARRPRHAAARGVLPAARKRHHRRHRCDLGRARLVLRARQGFHWRRKAPGDQGQRAGEETRPLRHGRQGRTTPGNGDRGRGRGDLGHALAHARPRHRARLRAGGRVRHRDRSDDRRPGAGADGHVVKRPIYEREE